VLDLDNNKLDNVSTYHISVLRLLNNTLLAAIDYYEFHSIDCSYIEQP
jgi:hypothetical protein